MTVKEAIAIVRAKYPEATVGILRGTAWLAVKTHPFGPSVGPHSDTKGNAWKLAAAVLLERAEP